MTKVKLNPLTLPERLKELAVRLYWKFRTPVYGVLLGGPGAGKGTLAEKLAPELGISHISTGNLLRREVANNTEIGRFVDPIMVKGDFVPNEITVYLLAKELCLWKNRHGTLLDGFPRSVEQANLLDKLLKNWRLGLNAVVFIEVPEKDLIERITGRRTCSNSTCGSTFHIIFNPPKVEGICDKCGSPLIKRKDDNETTIGERLKLFNKQIAPLVDLYRKQRLIHTVTSTNNGGIDDVSKQARKFFDTH
ncbi:MAG: nucleoside monophosphate kinase [Candidatus Obscuribacterales bacterium]|nr:nucleoside monophosphate kinase [Candidatus Obscuribacterales bacterium]